MPTTVPTRELVARALRDVQAPPVVPPWRHRVLPPSARQALAALGWWQDPTPQPPSRHLAHVLAVLRHYGWTQSQDVTLTGRMCVRGAQAMLQRAGHVTPTARARAVEYMESVLRAAGVHMAFFAWNDLPGQDFPTVEKLLTAAAYQARKEGE
ncbi:hypothetical protein [Streptomyces sp. NPDC057702]|uniref:DUF6197 family protein n=1 Tax=Streptomyces sp. NPDC057702 TaxID=3346221 RepID=UPI0036BCCEFB